MALLARKVPHGLMGDQPNIFIRHDRRNRIDLYMSPNEKPVPFYYNLRQYGAVLLTFRTRLGGWLGQFADNISPPNARKTRRQLRRWLKANGLTIVLVSAIMILAWIVAER
jgi:hypothetical protein